MPCFLDCPVIKGSLIRVRSNYENSQTLIASLSRDGAVIVWYRRCTLVQESAVGVGIVEVPLGDQRAFYEAE